LAWYVDAFLSDASELLIIWRSTIDSAPQRPTEQTFRAIIQIVE
jgi:hypothetical protein